MCICFIRLRKFSYRFIAFDTGSIAFSTDVRLMIGFCICRCMCYSFSYRFFSVALLSLCICLDSSSITCWQLLITSNPCVSLSTSGYNPTTSVSSAVNGGRLHRSLATKTGTSLNSIDQSTVIMSIRSSLPLLGPMCFL